MFEYTRHVSLSFQVVPQAPTNTDGAAAAAADVVLDNTPVSGEFLSPDQIAASREHAAPDASEDLGNLESVFDPGEFDTYRSRACRQLILKGIRSKDAKNKYLPYKVERHDGVDLKIHPMKYSDRQVDIYKFDYPHRSTRLPILGDPYGDDWQDPKAYVGDVIAFVSRHLYDKNQKKSRRGTVIDLRFEQPQSGSSYVKRTLQIMEHATGQNSFIVPVNVHELLEDLLFHVLEPKARSKAELVHDLSNATFYTECGVNVTSYHKVFVEDKSLYRSPFRNLVCVKANGPFPQLKTLKKKQAGATATAAVRTKPNAVSPCDSSGRGNQSVGKRSTKKASPRRPENKDDVEDVFGELDEDQDKNESEVEVVDGGGGGGDGSGGGEEPESSSEEDLESMAADKPKHNKTAPKKRCRRGDTSGGHSDGGDSGGGGNKRNKREIERRHGGGGGGGAGGSGGGSGGGGGGGDCFMSQLQKLSDMHDAGKLTDEQYERSVDKILSA